MSISPVDAVGSVSSQNINAKKVKRANVLPLEKLPPFPQQGFSSDSVKKARASTAASAPYPVSKISTEGFVGLRVEKSNDFQILDKIIERIHKNIEELGEALENLAKLIEKTDKQTLGLQILQETFDAIDEIRSKVSKK